MEKPLFPSKYIRITQGYNEGTHKDSYAIDNAGKDSEISDIYAPFTGIIKKIYSNDANEVWLESIDKVIYPDGTIDYMTIMFAHDNNIDNLFVGKRIKQNEVFYQEGTKGNVTGNHCHIECAKGKFTGTGWYKNNSGYWSINNGKKPEECLWIDDSITVLNSKYKFKKISTEIVDKKDDIKPVIRKNEFIFVAPKTDLYGVYLKEKQKLIIED
ncbi:MAG: hypothetical protein IJG97_06650 [Bacilli bacterium]|nr:hypothetical protein [Bacilli bacterium]